MSKHTDGPWIFKRNQVKGDCDHIATVAWVEDYCVGRDCGSGYSRNYEHHGRGEDDARLIAAAPELLEALQLVLDAIGATEKPYELAGYGLDSGQIAGIYSAIRKATGES